VIELDSKLIKQASRGDRRAFKALYDHYAPFVWKVIYRTVNGDNESATEVMQTTFIRIHGSIKKFSFDSGFSTWAYRIAYNAALSHLGRRRVESERAMEYQDTVPGKSRSDSYDDQESVRQILFSLSPDDRFLLTAREANGLSFEELSAVTGKTEGALRVSIHRIKERIRKEFGYEYAA